jgi:hypothetical protein
MYQERRNAASVPERKRGVKNNTEETLSVLEAVRKDWKLGASDKHR